MPDPAIGVVAALMDLVAEQFATPTGPEPTVHFFAGDGPALAAWDSHASQGCAEPFIWVLAQRRYRSQTFPAPTIDTNPCSLTRVIALQIGVGRCVNVDEIPNWDAMKSEAARSLADSYAIEQAMCKAAAEFRLDDREVGTDTLLPYGPEGGVVAWTGVIYVSL